MLKRQKILLQLLANANGSLSRTRLTKLAFLLSQLGKSEYLHTFYEFLPYLYGPYSFTLNHELDTLLRSGTVSLNEKDRILLTKVGHYQIENLNEPQLSRDFELVEKRYGALDQNSFIDTVYEQYPWFTINSKKPTLQKPNRKTNCANYTIGYQFYQVDGLLNFLLQRGIERLVDTRLNPISRRYGYHRSTLFALCKKVGIEYIHIPEVGGTVVLATGIRNRGSF